MKLNEESSDFVYLGKRIDKTLNYIQNNKTDLLGWFKQYVESPYLNMISGELEIEEEDYIFDYLDSLVDDLEIKYNTILENKKIMTNEQLRMQMLSGIITEGEYKAKLNEQPDTDFVKSEMERHISMVNDNPKIIDQEKKRRIDNIRFVVYDFLDPNTNGGKRPSSDFQFDDNWWNSIPSDIDKFVIDDAATDLVRAANGGSFGENDKPLKEKKSLKESMIGGIVGIGAINQIPPREKANYETAFEHFLGQKYGINEEMENESINTIEDLEPYLKSMFPNSEITLSYDEEGDGIFIDGVYVSEGAYQKWDTYIESTEKEKSFQSTEELIDYLKGNLMEEGKEVEEPSNY